MKAFLGISSFLGIAFYAIPGSIFTSALLEKINDKKQRKLEEQEREEKEKEKAKEIKKENTEL